MSKNSTGRLIFLVGVLGIIVGGYLLNEWRLGSKPSKQQIVADCHRIAGETTLWAGRGNIPIERISNPFRLSSSDCNILGMSVSGNEAIVKMKISLVSRKTFQILPQGGGNGFGKYFTQGAMLSELQESTIEPTLTYRKFDSGWRLESY